MSVPGNFSDYFYELQTQTGWGRTLRKFAEWCEPGPGWLTLDVGCGPGLLPAIFFKSGCKAIGVDLDVKMFQPKPLHPGVAVADAGVLPFASDIFDLVTASNLIFLLPQPIIALLEMRRLLKKGGKLALLNPSENLSVETAAAFVQLRGLQGLARDTLLGWAKRAEENQRWSEEETESLYQQAGFKYMASIVQVGPGFARCSWGTA